MIKTDKIVTARYSDGSEEVMETRYIEKTLDFKSTINSFKSDLVGKTVTVKHAYNATGINVNKSYTTGEIVFFDDNFLVLLVNTPNTQKKKYVTFPREGFINFEVEYFEL